MRPEAGISAITNARLGHIHNFTPRRCPALYFAPMQYDMQPYKAISALFTRYLYQRGRELETRPGMSQIQLNDGSNYERIDRMKDDFCREQGINRADVNIKWALSDGLTEYTIKHLGYIPKVIDWEKWQRDKLIK